MGGGEAVVRSWEGRALYRWREEEGGREGGMAVGMERRRREGGREEWQ